MKFTEKSFQLLKELEADNSKEWFDCHRDDVKTYLQEPFAAMLATIIRRIFFLRKRHDLAGHAWSCWECLRADGSAGLLGGFSSRNGLRSVALPARLRLSP